MKQPKIICIEKKKQLKRIMYNKNENLKTMEWNPWK